MNNTAFLLASLRTMAPEHVRAAPSRWAEAVLRSAEAEHGAPIDMSELLPKLPPYSVDAAHARGALVREALRRAVARHPELRLVVLGAGLDTLGAEVAPRPTWELDLPDTQAFKRAVARRIDDYDDAHITYVPHDLAAGGLRQVLAANGWGPEQPTFVALVGVVPYLTDDQARALFQEIGELGTVELFFDHLSHANEQMRKTSDSIKHRTGEELRSYMSDAEEYVPGFVLTTQWSFEEVLREASGQALEVSLPMVFSHYRSR